MGSADSHHFASHHHPKNIADRLKTKRNYSEGSRKEKKQYLPRNTTMFGKSVGNYTVKLATAILYGLLLCGNLVQAQYQPIAELNVEAYLGRWYQMYTNFGFILLELGGRCTTADYELVDGNLVSILNQSRPKFLPGFLARTTGFAVQGDQEEGVFTVTQNYLFPASPEGVEFKPPGNYWIIAIGPIVNNQYEWVSISNEDKTSCFILARDPETFPGSEYEQEALRVFEENGFDSFFVNKPIPTSHKWCGNYGVFL